MTLKYDDTRLSSAFRALGKKGENELDKFLKKLAEEEMNQVKKELKKLAGGLASVVVPSPKGLPYGRGTNIHTKVADALKRQVLVGLRQQVILLYPLLE
mgnify:CR=1 FL=1